MRCKRDRLRLLGSGKLRHGGIAYAPTPTRFVTIPGGLAHSDPLPQILESRNPALAHRLGRDEHPLEIINSQKERVANYVSLGHLILQINAKQLTSHIPKEALASPSTGMSARCCIF